MKNQPCKYCGGTNHTSLMCFHKKRRRPKPISDKKLARKQATDRLWYELNPPSERGTWDCYLNISPLCPRTITRSTITLEHVRCKARYPSLIFDVTNLRSACEYCNALKGSQDIEELVEIYPHLISVLTALNNRAKMLEDN